MLNNGCKLYVAINVDDILILFDSTNMITNIKKKLSKTFKMKDIGEVFTSLLRVPNQTVQNKPKRKKIPWKPP